MGLVPCSFIEINFVKLVGWSVHAPIPSAWTILIITVITSEESKDGFLKMKEEWFKKLIFS